MKAIPVLAAFAALTLSQIGAAPIAVTVTMSNDNDIPGYVTKADDSSLYVSQFENGANARPTPLSSIKEISWREPDDWKEVMELWNRNEYGDAVPLFAAAAENYKGLTASKHPLLKDNIGALAVYYYMESLRRTGKFKEMIEPYVRVQKLNLGQKWQKQIELFQGWSHFAEEKWEPLMLLMKRYALKDEEIPGVGDYTVAPNESPIKIEIGVHEMVQVAFLRGSAVEALSDKAAEDLAALDPRAEATREDREALIVQVGQMRSQALTDYARATTLNYGSSRGLALRSILASIRLLKKDETFDDNYPMQKEAHGLAVLFDGITGGKLPTTLKPLLKPPVDPEAGEGAGEE
jgi:hypothetical protein